MQNSWSDCFLVLCLGLYYKWSGSWWPSNFHSDLNSKFFFQKRFIFICVYTCVWLQVCTCGCSFPQRHQIIILRHSLPLHPWQAWNSLSMLARPHSEIWQPLPPECRTKACVTEPCVCHCHVLIMCTYVSLHVHAGAHRDLTGRHRWLWGAWCDAVSRPWSSVHSVPFQVEPFFLVLQSWILFKHFFSFYFFECVGVFCLHVCLCIMYTVSTKARSGPPIP